MEEDTRLGWWRAAAARVANDTGERVYVVEDDDPNKDCRSRGTFAVCESMSTAYERGNAVLVIDPEARP